MLTAEFTGPDGPRGQGSHAPVDELDKQKLPHRLELKCRNVRDAAAELGAIAAIREAFIGFQRHLY